MSVEFPPDVKVPTEFISDESPMRERDRRERRRSSSRPGRRPDTPDLMIGNYHLRTLESDLRNIIEDDLPDDLHGMFGVVVETEVVGKRYTSLTMFFSAAIIAYPLVASYGDFVESVKLIKKHCQLLADALDDSKYGGMLHPNVEVYHPQVAGVNDGKRMPAMPGMDGTQQIAVPRRDVFFWYLVLMNLALLALVGTLVYRAVVHTYFELPRNPKSPAVTNTAQPARTTT